MKRGWQTASQDRWKAWQWGCVLLLSAGAGCDPSSEPRSVRLEKGDTPRASRSVPSAEDAGPSPFLLVDRAKEAGVELVPRNGVEAGERTILETLGVGVAIWDYDRDGQLDLFIPGGGDITAERQIRGRPGALYRATAPWSYQPVDAGLADDQLYTHAASAGDLDNDGFPDLVLTGYGRIRLFHNQGDGTFAEVTDAAGLKEKGWSTSAAWGDFNGDAVPDLFVVNYVTWSWDLHVHCADREGKNREVCSPTNFEGQDDSLYFGDGAGGFRRAGAETGLAENGKGLAVLAGDVDLDGDLDLYVGNDTTPNFLYANRGAGEFDEVGMQSGTALGEGTRADGSMGVDLGDFDRDGWPDLWVANYEHQSFALYRNLGNALFQHISSRAGINAVGQAYVGFGTLFVDLDRDGDEDLFATNGHVMHYSRNAPFQQAPLLMENQEGRWFVNRAARSGTYLQEVHLGRGMAAGDLDRDGDLDLVVAHTNAIPALLANESPNRHHWLKLRLVGRAGMRDAIGARIELQGPGGRQQRQVMGGRSYLSSSDLAVFFGLGSDPSVDRVVIHWPRGEVQTLNGLPADREYLVVESRPPQEWKP